MNRRGMFRLLLLAAVFGIGATSTGAIGQEQQSAPKARTEAFTKGERVFTCAHSFHFFVPHYLPDVAKSAGIEGHTTAGLSAIGGSRVIQHWNVQDEKNKAKQALRSGDVDVLTLSPIYLPDEGIEKFVRLAREKNPEARITVQEFWLPYDVYDPASPLKNRRVDHNSATVESLRKSHEPYFKSIDDHVRQLNADHASPDSPAVFVVPVGQAVLALREKILAGEASGLKTQDELFTDPLGHPMPPIQALATYCHFAVIYRRSPEGLPLADSFKKAQGTKIDDQLNRLLQQLAWEAVTEHPLSGVSRGGRTQPPARRSWPAAVVVLILRSISCAAEC